MIELKITKKSDFFPAMQNMKAFHQLLNYPDDFAVDLVIYDYTLGPCFLGFVDKFNSPPIVAVSAYNKPATTPEVVGGHQFYAYVPHIGLSLETKKLDFVQRLKNLIIYSAELM